MPDWLRFQLVAYLIIYPFLLLAQGEQTVKQASISYQIEKSFVNTPLPQLKWILEEQKEALSSSDLRQGNYKDARWIDLVENPVFDLKAHTYYWTHIQLSSSIDVDTFGLAFSTIGNGWPWEFTFKNVAADIYQQGKKPREAYSGSGVPFSERDFPEKINPSLIWAKLAANDTLDIWLKLRMAESEQASIQVELLSKEFSSNPSPANFYFSTHLLLNGIGFALLFLAFALYIWFRDPTYLWFMLIQIFLIASTYFQEFPNEVYLAFFKEHPRLLPLISTYLSFFRILTLLQFGRLFIGTKIKFPKIHRLISLAIALFFILTNMGLIARYYPSDWGIYWLTIRQIPMGATFVLMFSTLLYLAFSKDRLARVFSWGILLSIGFTLIRLIIINVKDQPGESYITVLNHGLLVLTTTLIIAYRFVNITLEKRSAQKEKLASDLEQIKQKQLAEQKTKEAERLEELDKIKTNFFSNITHEFRTPLTLIIEPLRQVIDQPNKAWLPKVELAKNNSEKLLHLVNQLLDLSKLEDNKMLVDYRRGNISELINPMINSFEILAKEKNIQLNYTQENEVPTFNFDPDKMEKIISNLISNAIKFTPKKGNIDINVGSETLGTKPYFSFSIKDTGIGISKEEQAAIFDRFYQVDGSNTRKQQGTGIGLSLCKELVDLMEGSLELKSTLGKGSTFSVQIPMRFNEEAVSKLAKQPLTYSPEIENVAYKTKAAENSPIDIEADNLALIIEDNAELRQFIRSSIEDHYQVIEAPNGKEGLRMAFEYIPNIIISDVMMPEMDGFEVCRNTKTNEKTAHIPLILLTAKTAIDSRLQGLEYGADVYMNKPFSTKELLLRMKNLIELRRMLQVKFSQQLEESAPLGNIAHDIEAEHTESSTPIISAFDENFLERLNNFLEKNLDKEELTIEELATEMAMSRSQLFRKLKGLLNQSPSEFIRNYRLKIAKQFLEAKKGNITEIAYMVGFSNQKYFSTKFKEKYGLSPKEI